MSCLITAVLEMTECFCGVVHLRPKMFSYFLTQLNSPHQETCCAVLFRHNYTTDEMFYGTKL